ncbi:hypothetical protein FRB90_012731 [Tulasnella sp. 427]|nr:hypothetical protein FRB90_012731 [Tulasnella sp. 427]
MLGELGPGLRSLHSLPSSLVDLEIEEERRRARRFDKSKALEDQNFTPESSSFSSTSNRHRSPFPTDLVIDIDPQDREKLIERIGAEGDVGLRLARAERGESREEEVVGARTREESGLVCDQRHVRFFGVVFERKAFGVRDGFA